MDSSRVEPDLGISAESPGLTRIAELERVLEPMLRNQVPELSFERSLKATLAEWSRAVLAIADACGVSVPSASELARGLQLARSPVFICGTARAGTTLLRDLLDGHPELIVIPVESGFYGLARPMMQVRGDLHRAYFAARWLESLARAQPSWLLPPARSGSPYVAFARDFAGWWEPPKGLEAARNSSWPLAAFALAYGHQLGRGRLPGSARMWVEKTPGHWRYLDRIWADFPAAKVIQIVRHPEAVLASHKAAAERMPPHRVGRRQMAAQVLKAMAPAYRLAANCRRRCNPDRYHLVRYEELTANPEAAMRQVARFLGIEPLPSLLQPTVAGRLALGNSSFGPFRPDISAVLDRFDKGLLAIAVKPTAAKLGYRPN